MKFFKEIKEAHSQRDAYQRDYDSSVSGMGRPNDHRGLGQELAHETNNLQISINGRPWKVFAGRGTADSPEEFKYVQSMKAWAEKKSAASGKKWTVSLTGAPVSEGAELKKQKRLYNQAAKDANADQVGAGKKIDTMKNSLRQKDVVKKKEVDETQLLENDDDTPMYGAIIHRIMVAHPDLLQKYGPEKIMMAAQEEAEWVGDVEEIGSSDVSISVKRVMQALQEEHPTESIVEDDVAEGVQDTMTLSDAVKVLKQYGAEAFKTTSNELHFYKNGRPLSIELIWNDDATRSVKLGELNHVVRTLKAQDNKFNFNPKDNWSQDFETRMSEGINEESNPEDVISMDVPLFIRLMEYAREDASSDMDLHDVAENATKLSAEGATLTMNNYDAIIPSKDVGEPAVPADSTGEETSVTEATGHAGYDNMLAVMKAVEAGQDATFNLAGEPVTLEYPEARFLAGKYKAFLKAGRQEEFLKYMNDPVMFDRLMLQLRQLIDKQKNFKGSVSGERGVEEAAQSPYAIGMAAAKKKYGYSDKPAHDLPKKVIKKAHEIGDKIKADESLSADQYYCQIDKVAKTIPEGYKKLASGYITRK